MSQTEIREVIMQAIRERKLLKVKYQSASSGLTIRFLAPYALFEYAPQNAERPNTYVSGLCGLHDEVRTFRLDHMDSATLTSRRFSPTGQRAVPPWARRAKNMFSVS